jgi:hypothetical protein
MSLLAAKEIAYEGFLDHSKIIALAKFHFIKT